MKKTLLTLFVFGTAMMLQAQIIFNVLNPAGLAGNYTMTHASDWALTPDLADPANAVIGQLAFVDDGSAADSLGCLALVNGPDILGKIAVVYRGNCQFGTKALNASIAGAIAVVIINNVPGSPVGMASGDVGDQVTIPVVMISAEAGALLRQEIINGNVDAFIGNKLGFFDYDLGFFAEDVYLPNGLSIPSLVAQNGSEFSYTPAAWINNYGAEPTAAARFNATITFNGNTVYSQSVTGMTLASGENMYVSTPAFAPATWTPGLYVITLSVSYDGDFTQGEVEEYEGDNTYTMNLMISGGQSQVFTRSSINPDGTMLGGPGYRVNDGSAFSACVAYTHPNAGRMAVSGMYFGATASADNSIANEVLGLTVWRMNTPFTDINDPNYSVEVTLVANADFDIPADAENGDIFFSPVRTGDDEFLILEDNQRYVFCVGTDNENVFILFDGGGLDNRRQYEGLNGNAQPDYYIYTTGLGRFTDFYGLPAIGVEFFDKNLVSVNEENIVDLTPYPNPTTQFLNIPLNNMDGAAQLNIFDANGRLISSDNVSVENNTLTVDVQNMATGIYTFTMAFENGKSSTFKVMINK
jgi:hypothetical protein